MPLYNILLDHYDMMLVNGLLCETLNPINPIAKHYRLIAQNPIHKLEFERIWNNMAQIEINSHK